MLDQKMVPSRRRCSTGGPAAPQGGAGRGGGGFQEDGVRMGGPAAPEGGARRGGGGFLEDVFEWEAQLLQRPMLDEREVPSRRRCSTGRPSCFRGRC